MRDENVNSYNTLCLAILPKSIRFKLSFLSENVVWPLLDQNDIDDEWARKLLTVDCSFVNYLDAWPE
jgi:hypothetical protein